MSHVATIVDVLVVSSSIHDYITMMDTKFVSSLTTTMNISTTLPSIVVVDTCIVSSLTTIDSSSPIINCIISERREHIALRIEEVADDIEMKFPTKVVERSIIR